MEQTFNDLYNERKRQTERGLFGFVLWMFIETAIGIVHEYIFLIKEMNPMKNILTNLRLPAIISFLIILPFMIMELVNRQSFFVSGKESFPFPLFGFLWLFIAAIILILMPLVRNLRAGNNIMATPELTQENTILTNPTSAAIIGYILALPFLTILSLSLLSLLGIKLNLGPLDPLLNNPDTGKPNVLLDLIALGIILLAVAACLIARAPIVRTVQAGGSLFAHPMNLMLAVLLTIVILSLLTMAVVSTIVDQMPCFLGVPNCD